MVRTKTIVAQRLFLLLASCVTVNIYFPAAEAETAASTIVRDVLGTKGPRSRPSRHPPHRIRACPVS